jgi:hypothetical protein
MLQFMWACLRREPSFSRLVHDRVAIALARGVLQSQTAAGDAAGAGESPVGQCIVQCLQLAKADPGRNMVTALAVIVALPSELSAVPVTSRQREVSACRCCR